MFSGPLRLFEVIGLVDPGGHNHVQNNQIDPVHFEVVQGVFTTIQELRPAQGSDPWPPQR
jgi:hypothetical protein